MAYAHFGALTYGTFFLLFSERDIPRSPFSGRSPKIARVHPKPHTFMGGHIRQNKQNMRVSEYGGNIYDIQMKMHYE